jgi:hypothetical protein
MRHRPFRVAACTAIAAAAACSSAPTAPKNTQPVAIHVAAAAASPATAASPLALQGLRLAVNLAALGSGDQFGCIDCQGGPQDTGSEVTSSSTIVTVPPGGGSVQVATEQVGPGRYQDVELELAAPSAQLLAANPDWTPGVTIEIKGTFSGKPFTLTLAVDGTFREHLAAPVDVPASGSPGPITVTITLPVADWFTANGASLDPNDAAQRAQIEANARRFFQPVETTAGEG